MAKGELEYRHLTDALQDTRPDCEDDDRFTADHLTLNEMDELSLICSACPLASLCLAYARAGKPQAGFWAGKSHTKREYETRKETK